WRGRCTEVDGAGLQACDRTELLSCRSQAGERLGRAGSEHVPGLGEATATTRALDQPLTGGGFEQAQVLARAGLADADRCGRGGDASLPLDLDEKAHPGRVPELVQCARRAHIRYR